MTPTITEIEKALSASTQGTWKGCHDGNCICGCVWSVEKDFIIARTELNHMEDLGQNIPKEVITANAKLIAMAPEAMRALLTVTKAAMKLRDKLQSGETDDYQSELELFEALKAVEG